MTAAGGRHPELAEGSLNATWCKDSTTTLGMTVVVDVTLSEVEGSLNSTWCKDSSTTLGMTVAVECHSE